VRNSFRTYALGLAAVGLAVALRWALDPLMGDAFPLVTLFGAVAAAVWLGGYRVAIPVALVGYVACHYLFISPRGHFNIADVSNQVGLVAYLFTCALITVFGEAARVAQHRTSQSREVFRVTLRSIGDGVITTDIDGRVTYINGVAESLTGWTQADALGQPLERVFRIVNEVTRQSVENPAMRALREGVVVGLANHTVLIKKDGTDCPIDDSAAPIRNEQGLVSGCVLIFRDVTVQRLVEREKANQLHTARLLASIVESSMQVDRSAERSQDGLGIGLTLVKRLAEMHGGTIEAKSEGEGQGSEFIVRLPICQNAAHAWNEEEDVPAESSAQRRILIVDDNKDSADSLALLLKITGNKTYMAHDGVEAVQAIEKYRPEVVLLDIGLPKLDGHEVCKRVREQPWGKDIVVIALTGWGQEDDRRKSEEAGFNGDVVKPVDYDELLQLLG
jgi:PAS domain S-box-containing protein